MKIPIILVSLMILIILIGFLPLRFRIQYRKKEKDDYISFTWQILPGFLGLTAEIPFLKISTASIWPIFKIIAQLEGEKGQSIAEKETEIIWGKDKLKNMWRKLPGIISRFDQITALGKWMLNKITLREFYWLTEFGTKDAAKTGILVGTLWSLKTIIYGYLHSMVKKVKKNPQISVCPDFQNKKTFCNLICIFDISCGHIIISGFKAASILFLIKIRR